MKICNRCKAPKELTEFHRNSDSPDGFRSICAICSREGQADYRARTKKQKAAYDRKRWAKNRDKLLARNREWVRNNPERKSAIDRNRYARKIGQLGFVPTDIKALLREEQQGLCYYCSCILEQDHLEHKTPLARGGMHDVANLCLACPDCNLRKGTKTEEEFAGGDVLSSANVA